MELKKLENKAKATKTTAMANLGQKFGGGDVSGWFCLATHFVSEFVLGAGVDIESLELSESPVVARWVPCSSTCPIL